MSVAGLAVVFFFFFFNDTATTEIYTLSLHDALPICRLLVREGNLVRANAADPLVVINQIRIRSEEHTSELQSQSNLVCRLLLEKKKKKIQKTNPQRAHLHHVHTGITQ